MSKNDPEISDLLKELDSLKDAENEVEYSFYAQKIINQYYIVEALVLEIPEILKKKYSYPFMLPIEEHRYVVGEDGFKHGNTDLKIVSNGGQTVLVIFEGGVSVTDTHDRRVAKIKQLKTHASDIGKLCVLFKKRLKEEIVEVKKSIKRKLGAF